MDGRQQPRLVGEVGAPPHWQPIPLRSIGCQCGGLLQCRGLLQTNLYTTGQYNAQRIRAGLQKTLWALPRHQLTGSLSGAYEWSARPALLERNETAVDLAYRYSITDSLYTVASARIARYNFDQFGRDDWTFGSGVELIWQINPSFRATASVFYDKNDSDGVGNFNEYQAWTSGVGVGLQWMF